MDLCSEMMRKIAWKNEKSGTTTLLRKKKPSYEIVQPMTKEFYFQAYAITHPGPVLAKPPCINSLHKANQLEGLSRQITHLVNQRHHALPDESRFLCDRMRYVELPKSFTVREKEAFCRRRDERRNGIHVYQRESLTRMLIDYIELKTFKGTGLI